MKPIRLLPVLFVFIFMLSACGQAAAGSEVYTTVQEATLNPGDAVPAPSGDVILTLKGAITQTNSGDALAFDVPALESIGLVEYDVDDPFVKKNIVYTGVLLSKLLEVAGASPDATTLTLVALDDYSVDMPIENAKKWPVLVATKADGEYMPIDKNGPLISVFPFNDFEELDHLTFDAFWVWSLSEIVVK